MFNLNNLENPRRRQMRETVQSVLVAIRAARMFAAADHPACARLNAEKIEGLRFMLRRARSERKAARRGTNRHVNAIKAANALPPL